MAESRSIIVGGGISPGVPFSEGAIPYISNDDPPTLSDSPAWRELVGGLFPAIRVGANRWPAATEVFKIDGGLIASSKIPVIAGQDSVVEIGQRAQAVIGPAALATLRNVVIGTDAGQFWSGAGVDSSSGLVVVGHNARVILNSAVAGVQPSNIVLIGTDAVAQGKTAAPNVGSAGVAIGTSVQLGSGPTAAAAIGVVIGNSARIDAGGAGVAVGGASRIRATVAGTHLAVAIGEQADAFAPGQILVGHNANGVDVSHIWAMAFGRNAVTRGPSTLTFGGQNTVISDVLFGGGDAAPGGQALLIRATNAQGINDGAADMTVRAGLSTGNNFNPFGGAPRGRIRFQTGTPGASGAAVQTPGTRFEVLPSRGTGGTAAESCGVNFENNLDGAGAAVGTLNTSPVAGDPTAWLVVARNGVPGVVPWWALP